MNFFRRSRRKSKARRSAEDNMVTWVGALAHEIKNPLNTMKLSLQLLQEDWGHADESKKIRALKRLKALGSEVDRLGEILNDFLRLARLPKPDLRMISVSSLLDELLDFIEPEAQHLHIEVVRDFDEDLPEIALDSGQIKQALLNLILNANQSMPTGGKLTVRAYRANGHVTIDVADIGVGIPPDSVDKLFGLFYSTKKEGTGLGLSIAERIVNMHGGEIRVKSQEGTGSTFSIVLPVHLDAKSDG